jgi:hypothetical protein
MKIANLDAEDDSKPRKRGRPPKAKVPESPVSATRSVPPSIPASAQTPQLHSQQLPQTSPSQASPTKSTPTKSAVLKALPTVRDHTTDQLNPEGDEYIPREFDDSGEKKVAANGLPLEGREYKCRTFYVPNRGNKLFMLATECARVLGYRDSYLLFNKNRSLHKIIANQAEKDDLIAQEILPYSYRSRQIAIVTARSMFRQFGSRLIVNGRRVRDDYWEAKARKQGFTEEDAAGEKRPGAAKQRMAEAQAEANNVSNRALPQGDVQIVPDPRGPPTLASFPMITQPDDMRTLDYSSVQRPRQEITGQAYQDRTQSSPGTEILNQAQQTADFNRNLGLQRVNRSQYIDDLWRRTHEPPASSAQQPGESDITASSAQALHSPQMPTAGGHQPMIAHQQQAHPQMIQQPYAQQAHPQNTIAQSPVRSMHQQIPGQQMHPHRSPSMPQHNPQAAYGGYQNPNQMWPTQPQPSPLSQQHPSMQYTQHMPSQSPHQQSPLHAPPQLHQSTPTGSLHGTPMNYPGMGGMSQPGYQNVPRPMYPPSQSPQHYVQQSTATTQPGMQGWAPGPQQQHGQPPGGWQF